MAIVIKMGKIGGVGDEASSAPAATRKYGDVIGWGATILACMAYGIVVRPFEHIRGDHKDHQTLAGLVCEHWSLMVLLLIPILIVAGKLGRDLGLPGLFGDSRPSADQPRPGQPGLHRDHGFGAAFWGALGATLLVAQVWTMIYYAEMVQGNQLFGVRHFTDVPEHASTLAHAMDWWSQPAFWNHGELLRFLGRACCPFLALLVVAKVLSSESPALGRRGWSFFHDVRHYLMGMAVGVVVVVFAAVVDAYLFHELLLSWWDWMYREWAKPRFIPLFGAERFSFRLPRLFTIDLGFPRASPEVKAAIMASYSVFAVTLTSVYAVLTQVFRPRLSPGLGICIILGLVGVACSMMSMLNTTGQAILLAAGLSWFVFCNLDPYKYRFPGMAGYYARGGRVDLIDAETIASRAKEVELLPKGEETLDRWRASTGQAKPRLVLVATTGGAYRASFWTTVVLDELGRCLDGFHRHVRLLTGASGGMVGAAYFAASMTESGPPDGGVTELLRRESGLDSLTPVIRRLVSRDLPRAFWPTPQGYDRGVELERIWETLAVNFPGLIEGERQGWRPSLIVSPMVIESGRRLLISNLDLGDLSENRAGFPGAEGGPGSENLIYSRPAVEFFRIFPDARDEFRLQTAVRMSATFPFASPAVNLPTDPPHRVVDAGYYDNYGVDLAASWIYEHRRWIRENTSGVALIQVRAYPCAAATLASLALEQHRNQAASTSILDALRTSFQGLTSPLEGGVNAREWSMRFRNAGQLRVLDDLLNDEPGRPRRFETFVFENFAEFAMNWFITDDDIDGMRRSIGATPSDEPVAAPKPSASPDAVGRAARSSAGPERILSALRQDTEEKTLSEKQRLIRWWRQGSPE